MFEIGLTVDIVMMFTGHKDRDVIERIYKNLNAETVAKNTGFISQIVRSYSHL